MTLGKEMILENERGSARARCVEDRLWKRLWTCRMTDYGRTYVYVCVCVCVCIHIYIYLYNLLPLTFFDKTIVRFSLPSSAPRVLSVSTVSI